MNYEGSSRLSRTGWRDVWGDFFNFLRSPKLPEQTLPFGRPALARVGALLALDWATSICFLLVYVTAEKAGAHLPKPAFDLKNAALGLVLLIALGAPLLEEFIFRLWLRGKPFQMALALVPWLAIGTLLLATYAQLGRSGIISLLIASGLAIVLLLVLTWRRRETPGWYFRIFPIAFWLTTVAFALAHLSNYKESISTLLLLMVIPQFIGGMIMGYARVTYGMWANLSLHIARNSLAVSMVVLAGS
jgi:membrane protease YdiL (CAAX protease family)